MKPQDPKVLSMVDRPQKTGKATQENPVNTKSMERHQKVNKVVKKMKVIFPTYSTYYWEPCMEQLGKKLT